MDDLWTPTPPPDNIWIPEPGPSNDMPGGLGRLIKEPDPRNYLAQDMPAPRSAPQVGDVEAYPYSRTYSPAHPARNQGFTSECTAYSLFQLMRTLPNRWPERAFPVTENQLYRASQLIDPWPGEDPMVKGTSPEACVKSARSLGIIDTFWWVYGPLNPAPDPIVPVEWEMLYRGPVLIATDWLPSMYTTTSEGQIRVDRTQRPVGGHQYLGFRDWRTRQRIYVFNSWGPQGFGLNGIGWFSYDDFRWLLLRPWAEVLGVEKRQVPR